MGMQSRKSAWLVLLAVAAALIAGILLWLAPRESVPESESVPDEVSSVESSAEKLSTVRASRIFASPNRHPPTEFAAYGILAFRSRPSPFNRDRHMMFCHAYLAVLPHASELAVPRSEQMVTVWPVSSDEASALLNLLSTQINRLQIACQMAVEDYGLVIAKQALKDAEMSGRNLSGGGPYLLAWSPSADKGKPDALVLVSDLSDITTYEQAQERFLAWSRDIESDPALWARGWDVERLRVRIRSWVDKYGEKALAMLVR